MNHALITLFLIRNLFYFRSTLSLKVKKTMLQRNYKTSVGVFISVLMLSQCSHVDPNNNKRPPESRVEERKENTGKLFGDEFLIFGSSHKQKQSNDGTVVSVNPYLWRGSLDVLTGIPLQSADAVGGVIITDWYAPNSLKNERIKIVVYITTTYLKSEGLRVSLHKQEYQKGQWVDVSASKDLGNTFEEAILSAARKRYIKAKSIS
jgi:hypothetical protein